MTRPSDLNAIYLGGYESGKRSCCRSDGRRLWVEVIVRYGRLWHPCGAEDVRDSLLNDAKTLAVIFNDDNVAFVGAVYKAYEVRNEIRQLVSVLRSFQARGNPFSVYHHFREI